MKKLHFITLGKIYNINGKYYTQKPVKQPPVIIREFSKDFDITTHLSIKKEAEEHKMSLFPLSSDDGRVFEHFIDKEGLLHFLRNFFYYRKKILSLPEDDIYFLNYPYRRILMVCAFILRKRKLVIWVRTDSVGIQRSNHFKIYGFNLKAIINTLINPFKSFVFILFSKIIFRNNLIFYSGNITINKNDHLNQHEIISCSIFNEDRTLIKKEKNFNIVFVGNESNERKGMGVFLKALRECGLKDKLSINIIGSDEFKIRRHKKLSEGLNVKFHGRISDRTKFYKILSQNDILVMPSFGEKQGKVQLEAMSVGVVSVCSDSGGTYKTISNYYNGLLFKPGDHRQLCDKIKLLYEDDDLYEDLKSNGLEYINHLSLEKQAREMSAIIKNYYSAKNL
ncbi:MAG: glycosyltransferase family 4 protein [Patescibacteria group bacterium]